jgi:hypothetical protein
MTLLIRVAFLNSALSTLERVLAHGNPSEATLRDVQAALQRERNSTGLLRAMRGERSVMHHLFCNLRDGKMQLRGVFSSGGPSGFNFPAAELWMADQFPASVLKHYPEFLRFQNRGIELAKLPMHERRAKLGAWEMEVRTKNLVIRRLAPYVTPVSDADIRTEAMVRSAMVAVACERYRLAKKEWPESLDVLVKEKLLDAVPDDPNDGQPLRYRRANDVIVVYSVGADRKDNGGAMNRTHPDDEGNDIGFRVWHPDHRRQPPMRPIAIGEEK